MQKEKSYVTKAEKARRNLIPVRLLLRCKLERKVRFQYFFYFIGLREGIHDKALADTGGVVGDRAGKGKRSAPPGLRLYRILAAEQRDMPILIAA